MIEPAPVVGVIGIVIRRLRKRAGISQERLAAESGIDRSYVGRVERHGASVGIATMDALLTTIRVSWAEFGAVLDAELACAARDKDRGTR